MVELAGDYEFAAPNELVWEMLLDPEVLARIMPGCKKLEQVDENEFEGQLNIRIGPVQGVFRGTVELTELEPPCSYHLVVNGRGPSGIVRGEGDLALTADGDCTAMRYTGQAQVSGRIATVGQRLMDSSAKAIVKQSLQNLDKQIQARLQPLPAVEVGAETAVSPPPSPALAAPSQTEFMLGVAKDVLADIIPDPRQRQLLAAAALLLGLVSAINWFANLVARRVAKILQEKERGGN